MTPLAPWGRFLVFFRFFSKILKVTLQKRVPENIRSCRWGAEQRVSRAQTREQGPPLAWAEFFEFNFIVINPSMISTEYNNISNRANVNVTKPPSNIKIQLRGVLGYDGCLHAPDLEFVVGSVVLGEQTWTSLVALSYLINCKDCIYTHICYTTPSCWLCVVKILAMLCFGSVKVYRKQMIKIDTSLGWGW